MSGLLSATWWEQYALQCFAAYQHPGAVWLCIEYESSRVTALDSPKRALKVFDCAIEGFERAHTKINAEGTPRRSPRLPQSGSPATRGSVAPTLASPGMES